MLLQGSCVCVYVYGQYRGCNATGSCEDVEGGTLAKEDAACRASHDCHWLNRVHNGAFFEQPLHFAADVLEDSCGSVARNRCSVHVAQWHVLAAAVSPVKNGTPARTPADLPSNTAVCCWSVCACLRVRVLNSRLCSGGRARVAPPPTTKPPTSMLGTSFSMYAFASLAAAPAGSRPPLPSATLDTGFTRPDDDGDVEEGAEDAMLTKERDRGGARVQRKLLWLKCLHISV